MYIVTVLPTQRGARTDALTYFAREKLSLGSLVRAPLRNKSIFAIVISLEEATDIKSSLKDAPFALKKITSVVSENALPKPVLTTINDVALFYATRVSTVLDITIPRILFTEENKKAFFNWQPYKIQDRTEDNLILGAPLEERIAWYRTRIRELFAQKKSIFFVLPTHTDVTYYAHILSRGIEEHTITLSSNLPKKKIREAIERIQNETHPVCIFITPQYVTLLRQDVGTIVLEKENARTYIQPGYPQIDMRLFIEALAGHAHLQLIRGDTIISVTTYTAYENGNYQLVMPLAVTQKENLHEMHVQRAMDHTKSKRETFSLVDIILKNELQKALERGERSFLFTLRTGLATMTICRDCGSTLQCEYCEMPLVLYPHKDKRIFVCPGCKQHTPSDSSCRDCGSWNLFPMGIGIDAVYETAQTLFPDAPVFRIDKTTTKTEKEVRKVLEAYYETSNGILIGTELALTYLTETIPLVAVVSFDSLFSIPSYQVSERIVSLVAILRERAEKNFVIQTIYPESELLNITTKIALLQFYRKEQHERQLYRYPPTHTVIKISTVVPKQHEEKTHTYLLKEFSAWEPDIFSKPYTKKKDFVRIITVLRLSHTLWNFQTLGDPMLREKINRVRQISAVEVNPEDLF